jgi:uncharacterized membrane protein YfcA
MTVPPDASIPAWALPILFATGFVAGFVDSIAGGGGLLTIPVLFSFHIPPQFALGTGKLQASFGSGSAAWHYRQSRIVSLRECVVGVGFTIIGAYAGTWLALWSDPVFLKKLIPVLLLAVAAYMIFKPKLGEQDIHPRLSAAVFYPLAGLALGFYDGFLGPGTGSFWAMALMLGLGFNLMKATAYTKVMNFASNLTSLAVFAWEGQIYYVAGLVMGAGQLLGARLGSRMVVAKGTRFIRPVFLTMVFALIVWLVYENWFGHGH